MLQCNASMDQGTAGTVCTLRAVLGLCAERQRYRPPTNAPRPLKGRGAHQIGHQSALVRTCCLDVEHHGGLPAIGGLYHLQTVQRHPFDIGSQRMPGGIQRFSGRPGLEGEAMLLHGDLHLRHP